MPGVESLAEASHDEKAWYRMAKWTSSGVRTAPKWACGSKVDIGGGSEGERGRQGCQKRVAVAKSISTFARPGAVNVHLRAFGEGGVVEVNLEIQRLDIQRPGLTFWAPRLTFVVRSEGQLHLSTLAR